MMEEGKEWVGDIILIDQITRKPIELLFKNITIISSDKLFLNHSFKFHASLRSGHPIQNLEVKNIKLKPN